MAGRTTGSLGVIVVFLKVDRLLVDIVQQFVGDFFETALGVAHGRCWIAVDGAEVALPVNQR